MIVRMGDRNTLPVPRPFVPVAAIVALSLAACSNPGAPQQGQASGGAAAAAPAPFGPAQQAALERAKTLYAEGQAAGAFESARAALTGGKESADAYALISRLFIETGQDRKAVEFFTLVANDLGGDAAHYFAGYHSFRLNEWDKAAESFRRAAEADPTRAEYPFRQGLVLQAQGDFPGAVEALRKARALDAASPLYAARLARLYRITGDYPAAETVVREGLAASPENGELLYASAQLRLREGKTDEAIRLLREAVGRAPDLREAHYDLSRALLQKGDRAGGDAEQRIFRRLTDDAEGLQKLSERIGLNPDDASLVLTVAEYHLTARRWPEALRTLKRAEDAGADPFRIACAKAEAHFGSRPVGRGEEALEAAAAAAGAKPAAEPQARLALARAAGALARNDAAAARGLLARTTISGEPPDKLFHLRVADAWEAAGDSRQAEEAYRRADALARPE